MAGKSKSGSSKKGRQSGAHKTKYARQATRTYRNKERAWARHIAKYPGDTKAKAEIGKARESMKKF